MWIWRYKDDQENGEATPTERQPEEFMIWREEIDIETKWFRLYRAFIDYNSHANQVDVISRAIVEYATHTAIAVGSILTRLAQQSPSPLRIQRMQNNRLSCPCLFPKTGKACRQMFAATLTVDLQTVRKCFVQTESYYGVRPSKLPSLRLL
jgi:hypothetical protein